MILEVVTTLVPLASSGWRSDSAEHHEVNVTVPTTKSIHPKISVALGLISSSREERINSFAFLYLGIL